MQSKYAAHLEGNFGTRIILGRKLFQASGRLSYNQSQRGLYVLQLWKDQRYKGQSDKAYKNTVFKLEASGTSFINWCSVSTWKKER